MKKLRIVLLCIASLVFADLVVLWILDHPKEGKPESPTRRGFVTKDPELLYERLSHTYDPRLEKADAKCVEFVFLFRSESEWRKAYAAVKALGIDASGYQAPPETGVSDFQIDCRVPVAEVKNNSNGSLLKVAEIITQHSGSFWNVGDSGSS